ncbi:Uncharacterized protein HZ326_30744 [Fusarium oxysporum f. sp. albedinis]|nr:Uncharacterized protein HZ326_30744 [Fusarium oxysporum f. sp. albedinis]
MSGSHTSPSPPSRVPTICPFRIQLPRHSTSCSRSHAIESRSHDALKVDLFDLIDTLFNSVSGDPYPKSSPSCTPTLSYPLNYLTLLHPA